MSSFCEIPASIWFSPWSIALRPPPSLSDCNWSTTQEQAIHLEVTGTPTTADRHRNGSLNDAVLQMLAECPAMTRQMLRERLAVKNQTLGEILCKLEQDGQIELSQCLCQPWFLRSTVFPPRGSFRYTDPSITNPTDGKCDPPPVATDGSGVRGYHDERLTLKCSAAQCT